MSSPAASASARSHPSGGRLIFAAQCLRVVVRLGTAALLARLLRPADYGLYSMAAIVYGVLHMAREFGVITALQQPTINRRTFSTCCRLSVLGGVALALAGLAAAIPTGWFFDSSPDVVPVLAGMSLALLFASAASPAIGLLYRARRSGLVALLDGAAMLISSALGIALAARGHGVWALVAMGVAAEVISCALAWVFCPPRPPDGPGGLTLRELLRFGTHLTGHNLAGYLTRTLDQFTVGRVDGAVAIGLYGRAAQLVALPTQYGVAPYSAPLVATLARVRENARDVTTAFQRALNSLSHVAFASAAVCVAVPELLVAALFGPQWHAAAPVARALALPLALQPWLSAPFWLLGSTGETRRLLQFSAVGALLMMAACAVAASRGIVAVAWSAAAAALLQAALAPIFTAGRTPVKFADWSAAAIFPALVHSGLALTLWLTQLFLPAGAALPLRSLAALAALALYGGALLAGSARLRHELRHHLFFAR